MTEYDSHFGKYLSAGISKAWIIYTLRLNNIIREFNTFDMSFNITLPVIYIECLVTD